MSAQFKRDGFTLVEIIIVVAIIGILAALSIPKLLASGHKTRSACFINEIKYLSTTFTQYTLDKNSYPADKTPGILPDGMSPYLGHFQWSEKTSIGGYWDWDYEVYGTKAAISVDHPNWDAEMMREIDRVLDDGNLGSGIFRQRSGGYMLVIEELN